MVGGFHGMLLYSYLRNIQDLLSDGKTPYERRFGIPFKGAIIPFSSMVEYHPNSAKDLSRLHTANIGAAIRQIPNSTNIFGLENKIQEPGHYLF